MRAQVTLHTAPPGSRRSPPPPGSRDAGTTSPGERTARLTLLQRHDASDAAGSPRLLRTAPSPRLSEPEPLPKAAAPLTPSCVSEEQTPSGYLHSEVGPNPKLSPGSCANKEKGNFSQQPQEQRITPQEQLISTINLMYLHLWNT